MNVGHGLILGYEFTRFQIMSDRKIKEMKAWFSSSLDLVEIGDKLQIAGLISDYDYDCENVYEWLECTVDDSSLELNVSRKHCDFTDFEHEPIHVMILYKDLEPKDEFVFSVAKRISIILGSGISVGTISYVGGDEFCYSPISKANS